MKINSFYTNSLVKIFYCHCKILLLVFLLKLIMNNIFTSFNMTFFYMVIFLNHGCLSIVLCEVINRSLIKFIFFKGKLLKREIYPKVLNF